MSSFTALPVLSSICNSWLTTFLLDESSAYIRDYEQANPGTRIRINMLQRGYANDVDIDTWANNVADSTDKRFGDKRDLIFIGHSMGGKAALLCVVASASPASSPTPPPRRSFAPSAFIHGAEKCGFLRIFIKEARFKYSESLTH